MRIRCEKDAISVDFIDQKCGCRRQVRVQIEDDGESLSIDSKTFQRDGPPVLDEHRVESFSVAKALAAALLLLEV